MTLPAARRALLTPGVRVGDVVVIAELGAGSSATVYRARPVPDVGREDVGGEDVGGEDVALKVRALAGEPADDLVDRFRREFELARLVAGPHVVPVYDHGLDRPGGGRTVLWLTMELVDGGTGTGLVPAASAEPDLDRVLPVLSQVAGALDRAHALDVLHRDVKPANVLLRPGSLLDAVLTDFGTAQLLADLRPAAPRGRVAGSLPYAAPELLTGGRLGPATDVYALACTAVEWLTGAPPFPRATAFAVTSAHLTDPPPDLVRRRGWLPAAAGEALARGLAKEPGDRFSSCGELARTLTAALEGVRPRPVPGGSRRRLLSRRPRPRGLR